MEGKEMECTVRHYRDMWRPNFLNERRHQMSIQLVQVTSRRLQYLLGMRRNIVPAEQKFFDLKSQAFLQVENPSSRRKPANDPRPGSRYDKRQDFVTGREILHQRCSFGQSRANRIDSCDRYLL